MRKFKIENLEVEVYATQKEMASFAAESVAQYLNSVLERQGKASVILASAASQILFLQELTKKRVDWARITFFHMDEYLGISEKHPASFRKFLKDRVLSKIKPAEFHFIQGDALEPITECQRYAQLLTRAPVELCCCGVGENGHIAFNDPPVANFHDPLLVKIVKLDEACRRQQVGEGAFPDINSVPQYAITLTVPALLSAKRIVCVCPETRKATAVKNMLGGEISTSCPASILRIHPNATLYLDSDSASLLSIK